MTASVLEIVQFCLQGGSIDTSFGRMQDDDLSEGVRIHKMIQRRERERLDVEDYVPEYFMRYIADIDGEEFMVTGRCDGIIMSAGDVIIDEIKSTGAEINGLTAPLSFQHQAQAYFYAFMYASEQGLEKIGTRITYCQKPDHNIRHFYEEHTIDSLRDFVMPLIREYAAWEDKIDVSARLRQTTIETLSFPFGEFRKGQRDMAALVYRNIKAKGQCYINAPTGIGKTVSALFPAVKAMGENACGKIFYLTAKTIGREVAINTVRVMEEVGLHIKSIVITAKETICPLDKTECNPFHCQYANGHFDRNKAAVIDIFDSENRFTREVILEYAEKHRVCPFEFSLDLSLFSDIIICDYNYLFDLNVYLRRFFLEGKGDYAFLIDEAHNLPDRAREMYSATLSYSMFTGMYSDAIEDYFTLIRAFFLEQQEENVVKQKEQPSDLLQLVSGLTQLIYGELMQRSNEALQRLYFDLVQFTKISELYGEAYTTYYSYDNNDIVVRLFCVDASEFLQKMLKRGGSAVFFSATLTPVSYFIKMCGGGEKDPRLMLRSPFDPNNLCLMVADISTVYKDRQRTAKELSQYITKFTAREGNYLIFFPSYAYMQMIYDITDADIVMQEREQSLAERESFLRMFDSGDKIVAFAVLGGVFSEGIDLVGDRLSGVAIVTVGMPQLSVERDIIREYYDMQSGNGYDYAYVYPGFNKLLQAAGRLIRSDTDKGSLLLLDSRLFREEYRQLYLPWWQPNYIRSVREMTQCLDGF